MLTNKTKVTGFCVDGYVDINEFNDIKLEAVNDPFYYAAVIGCIEGIVQINKEHLTFLNMYEIKLNSRYKFIELYAFLKSNKKYFEYIVNYFNLWHSGSNELFTYDEYSKDDLTKNFYELSYALTEEKKIAEGYKDARIVQAYNFFCSNIHLF